MKPAPGAGGWRLLARDPLVRLQCLAVLVVAVPYLVPWLTADQLWSWSTVTDLPLLAVTLVAFRWGLDRLTDAAERRFWNLWTLAMGAWATKTVALVTANALGGPTVAVEMTINGFFFLFYFFAALALESRPNLPDSRLSRALRAVERVGTFVFFTGLLAYLALIPALLDRDAYETSGLLFYVMLDGYLVVRLTGFLRGPLEGRWRRIYGWMLATAALWLVTDAMELLMWSGRLDWMIEASWADLFWLPAWLTMVVAARARHISMPSDSEARRAKDVPLGPLVVLIVAVPIGHLAYVRMVLTDPDAAPVLEILALVTFLVLAALMVVRQELLRGENRRLEAERRRDRQHIEHLAFHDPLTEIPNRRLLTDRLQVGVGRTVRFERQLAVLMIDLDGFKSVNDTMGHDAGDEVLRQVARRLEACVRGGDTVARYGGDEFVAVVEGLRGAEDASRVWRLLEESLQRPFEVAGRPLGIAASIGMAIFPEDGATAEALLKQADVDMYRRKRQREHREDG